MTINIQTWIENVDKTENKNEIVVHQCMTFLRPPPPQSARNPQKNELLTTPMKHNLIVNKEAIDDTAAKSHY